jgi:hypothetical protein
MMASNAEHPDRKSSSPSAAPVILLTGRPGIQLRWTTAHSYLLT